MLKLAFDKDIHTNDYANAAKYNAVIHYLLLYPHFSKNILNPPKNEILDTPLLIGFQCRAS